MSFDKTLAMIGGFTSGGNKPQQSRSFRSPIPQRSNRSGQNPNSNGGILKPLSGPQANGLSFYGKDPLGYSIFASSPEFAQRVNRNNWAFLPNGSAVFTPQ